MRILIIIVIIFCLINLKEATADETLRSATNISKANNTDSIITESTLLKQRNKKIANNKYEVNIESTEQATAYKLNISSNVGGTSTKSTISKLSSSSLSPFPTTTTVTKTPLRSSAILTASTLPPTKMTSLCREKPLSSSIEYCLPSLCEFYNGSHTNVKPHIACKNSGNFGPACGSQPHLLKMNERRRNLILDLHNLARSRIASGQIDGYESASHMPQLKWDNELEYLAALHVKRCRFEHDLCHNTPRFPYSGQNMAYFWKGANFTSHSKRIKNFIVNWYQEHKDANQSFVYSFQLHPNEKVIGHFTLMVADRIHKVGCAVIRFYESNLLQILMTCNYDYNNFLNEPVYQTGPAASECSYKISDKYPSLCDWKEPSYEYNLNKQMQSDDNK